MRHTETKENDRLELCKQYVKYCCINPRISGKTLFGHNRWLKRADLRPLGILDKTVNIFDVQLCGQIEDLINRAITQIMRQFSDLMYSVVDYATIGNRGHVFKHRLQPAEPLL